MRIEQLPDNAMLTKVDNTLFRRNGYQEWLVTLYYKQTDKLKEQGNSDHKSVRFSNIPMLVSRRIYNSTETVFEKKYKQAEFIIQDLSNIANSDKNNFEYITDIFHRHKTFSQIKVKIPKLELARVLFFHNSYLAMTSLKERILDLDFNLKKEDGKDIINILPHCSLSKTQFEDLGFRSKLAWLLLNSQIKKSYYSVYENLVENKTESKEYERWLFDFTPPQLFDLKVRVKGYLNNNNIFYVDEILIIKGIDSGIKGEVEFVGDLFTQDVVNPGVAKISPQNSTGKEPIISDEHESNSDLSTLMVETPKLIFEFLTPIISAIKSSRLIRRQGAETNHSDDEDDEVEVENTIVATDEATIFGNAPKGDFQNAEDNTNRDTQYRQNFVALIDSLERLNLENLSFFCHELPRVPRCKLYRKVDGNPRILLEAKFNYNNQSFSIYEIDTTDLEKKRLSTLIVRDSHEIVKFDDLLEEIVRTSLTWSKMSFSGKINLPHPKDFYTGKLDSKTMIEGWSERILNSVNILSN